MLLYAALDALVVGIVLGAILSFAVRRRPEPAGAAVVAVVGALTGGLLGYALIAASRPAGIIQLWAIVGGAVGAVVAAFVWLRWTGVVGPLLPAPAPSRPPRPKRPPRRRSAEGGELAVSAVWLLTIRETWRRRR